MSKIFDLWNTVAGAFGPSGREDAVRETIAEIAGAYIDDVTTDALGNLICRKKGAKNGKKLLFAAHMDSIGVVATYIEDKGFIRFSQIGGLYVGDLLNIQVKFANGTRGVISYEEMTPLKDLTLDNLFIDIGAKNAEEARKLVQIGDFAVYEAPRFEQRRAVRSVSGQPYRLRDAPADDGAAGRQGNRNDLYFVFTAQEEVGLRGAGAAAFAVEPDAAIAVDVTDTGDLPEMKSAMAVELARDRQSR
ncbi:MAG: M42 family peptidase [Butyricicoccaceae bacterium]